MNIDLFLLRIVLLFLPGIIGYKTYRTLCSIGLKRKKIKDWEDFLNIFSFSIISYIILVLINSIFCFSFETKMLNAIFDQNVSINYFEISLSVVISILVGICGAYSSNKKIVFKFFQKLGITKHFGDEDVWSYINNSKDIEWVIVRDHRLNLMYYCYIMCFSDYGEKRELLLGDVNVYRNDTGEYIYHSDKLYICRDDYDLSIEIIDNQTKGEVNEQQEGNSKAAS